MTFGVIALFLAAAGAGWLLFQLARGGEAGGARNMRMLKGVVWLGLVAALFAAKLTPLALMVLVAAGGVMAIEIWRDRAIKEDEAANPVAAPPSAKMDAAEAASVLGVAPDASEADIQAAYKKLISQIHPDKGGTDYLAAKINEARDVMIGRILSN